MNVSQAEQLAAGLAELWQEGLLCDVKLQVDEKSFSVHRAVLAAASPYWKAMFTGNFRESSDKVVPVKDISSHALQEIISSIYCTKPNITGDNVMELFSAAHITQMVFIQDQCKEWMIKNVETSTCFPYLEFARKYDIKELEQKIEDFVCANFIDVVTKEREKFNSISQEALCRYLSSDSLRNDHNELLLYQAAKNWVQANENCDGNMISEIVGNVRFALINLEELSNIMYDDLITPYEKCRDMIKEAMRYHVDIKTQPFYDGVLNAPRGLPGLFVIPNGTQSTQPMSLTYNVTGNGEVPITKSPFLSNEKLSPLGMPVVYESMSSVHIGNFLFVFGVDNTNYQNFSRRYDASTNEWLELKPVPRAPTIGTCAVLRGTEIFLIGGVPVSAQRRYYAFNTNSDIEIGEQVHRYSVETDCWSRCPAGDEPLVHASAATLLGKIYITGGLTLQGEVPAVTSKSTIMFDVDHGNYERKANMNSVRCQHISQVVGDKLYVLGGWEPSWSPLTNTICKNIEAYDPVANQWTIALTHRDIGTDAKYFKYGASVCLQGDSLVIVGGIPASPKCIRYNVTENKVTTQCIDLPRTCIRLVCAMLTVQ